jgi:hypothetical protein
MTGSQRSKHRQPPGRSTSPWSDRSQQTP